MNTYWFFFIKFAITNCKSSAYVTRFVHTVLVSDLKDMRFALRSMCRYYIVY